MQPMQLTITLDGRESELLRKQSMRELRRPKDQARYLLRLALGLAEDQPIQISEETQNAASGHIRQDLATSSVL